jgi:hypothetical protein
MIKTKPKKELKHYTAYSEKKGKRLDLYYYSLKQAQYFNKSLIDWEEEKR